MAKRSRDSDKKKAGTGRRGKASGGAEAAPKRGRRTTEAEPPVYGEGAALRTPRRVALDAAFRNETDLRVGLTENLSQVRIRSERLDERVRRAFEDFHPTVRAKDEPASRNHVEPGAAPFEALGRVMRDRLDGLNAAAPGSGIAIRSSSSLIQWDGGGDDAGDAKSGTIELGKLIDFLDARGVSSLTLSTSSAVAACEVERKAQAVLDEVDGAAAGTQDGDEGDTPAASARNSAARKPGKVAEFVERSVSKQMGPATAPEASLQYGLIPNGADSNEAQKRLLETFQLRPGPSDVTSYHDFSTLQIAFEDVWTQIFDGELEALGRQVYREYVGLLDFLGYDPDTADRPISSLDDLAWLVGEIRSLSQIAQDGVPTGNGDPIGTKNIPKDSNTIAKDAEKFVGGLPGGRVGTALGTLGISELVLLLIRDAATWGRKDALRWDDLVNGRTLPRGDVISASVAEAVVSPGNVELVLWTDISNRKEIAFQDWRDRSQKPVNLVRVANWLGETINHSATGTPTWYMHKDLIPSNLLADGLLEFASQEGAHAQGRYVLGDLDKIVSDGGRLTFYWKDR